MSDLLTSFTCRLFQGAKLDKLDKSQHKLTFADIAGIDNVKAEVQELVEFLKNPRRFLDLGANSPAGVMLVGAPGTGAPPSLSFLLLQSQMWKPCLHQSGCKHDECTRETVSIRK